MAEIIEIYADTMNNMTVSKDGTVIKLVLFSARPDASGKVSDVPVLILTMPTKAANTMLEDIANAAKDHQQGSPAGPKN